jgi:TolB-like protein
MSRRRLDSWKAIARFLGRSERTVRRWESLEGLPVHRHHHVAQSSVYAFEDEVEAWRNSRQSGLPERQVAAKSDADAAPGVVVLPFDFLGSDEADGFLAQGFTDELITDLSRLSGLRVIARTSSVAVAKTVLSAGRICKLLGVDHLIEGSVRSSGEDLRVSVRLIEGRDESCLWSDEFDTVRSNVFGAQSAIARGTADALAGHLPMLQGHKASFKKAVSDRRVWEMAVRARIEAWNWNEASIRRAVALLQAASTEFGPAWELTAAEGRYHLFLREVGIDMGPAPLAAAKACLADLERSAPASPERHQLAGWIAYQEGDLDTALVQLSSANEKGPLEPDTMALLAYGLLLSGLDEDAGRLVRRLLSVDPLTAINHSLDACLHLFSGRFDDAVASYGRMNELSNGNAVARLFLVMALSLGGHKGEAAELARAAADSGENGPVRRLLEAFGDAASGRPISPAPTIDAVIQTSMVDMFPRLLAQAYGLAGQRDEALAWLRLAVRRGFAHHRFTGTIDPSFAGLRGGEGFEAVLAEMAATAKRRAERLPQSGSSAMGGGIDHADLSHQRP